MLPIRVGPRKPPRLPTALISAMPPAAAVPDSMAVGSVQKVGAIAGFVKRNRDEAAKIKAAHRTNANQEFSKPPSADMTLAVAILIALALIDLLALKWL